MYKKVTDVWKCLSQVGIKLTSIVFCIIFIPNIASALASLEGIQTYHRNLHLFPEHKQKLVDDIIRYKNADNVWDVLREEFSLPHYENNPVVQDRIEWFMNNQEYLLRAASRAAPYLYYILQQVRKRHLPAELVLLPIVESGYNPFSLSHMGAAGIWQLMPSTATGFGIKQDSWYDGRRDIIASTRGALNYLAYLQNFFEGNWLLAIAAYNTGEGNVLAAIKRNIRDGRPTDFWSLPVAQETRDYVPSLLALAIIISRPDIYPLYFPPVRNAPYLAEVDVGRQINLKYAASLAGLTYKKLMQLNPGFSYPSTAKGPYKLVIPIENVEQFSENLSRSPLNTPIKWHHYKVRDGETLALIARKFNTSISAIQKLNKLMSDSLHTGANLLIPSTHTTQMVVAEDDSRWKDQKRGNKPSMPLDTAKRKRIASSSHQYTLQPGDTIYMLRPNDTLATVAKRFKVDMQMLQRINELTNKEVKPGKQLIVPTSQKHLAANEITYLVNPGDTVEKIAKKFNTTASAIRLANMINENSLPVGKKIVVPMQLRG